MVIWWADGHTRENHAITGESFIVDTTTTQVPDVGVRAGEIQAEIKVLRLEIARLNSPQTFVECSKAERRLLALQKEQEDLTMREVGQGWE